MASKRPKRVRLLRFTFHRNDELKTHINSEFDVVRWKPDWQIPFGLKINGEIIHFAPDEVQVTAWEEESDHS